MKQSSLSILMIGALCVLVLALAGVMFQAQAQTEGTPPAEPASAAAAAPLFSYQGELRNASGSPITTSAMPMSFGLFAAPTGGSACWTENRTVNVQNGQFNVVLGQVTAIPASCVSGDAYLELVVNGETLSPREMLTAVAVAVKANTLMAYAHTEGPLTVEGYYMSITGGNLILGEDDGLGGNYMLRIDGSRTLHILPWSGPSYPFDQVCIGCGGAAKLLVNGSTQVNGNLDLAGTCARTAFPGSDTLDKSEPNSECQPGSIVSGAYVEANLMSPAERNSADITRFERGDLLCWSAEAQQLDLCAMENDRLVMAVADVSGKPIVLGAEPVKAIGPLRAGDLLVASGVPGYAMVNNDPRPGMVIGQALEDLNGESGIIKAMIRKW